MEKKKDVIKNKKVSNKVTYRTSEQDEMIKFVIVILVVLLCVGGVYLFTRAFITKDLFKEETNTNEVVKEGTVNYDVAIMGQLLNRPYKQYYAVIYDSTGEFAYDMSSLVSSYAALKDHKHVYTIDLANELNKNYYDVENVNTKATKVSEMKVGDITLVKVKNGKIEKYIVDYAKMQKELGVKSK
jgi:hypothetical protein